MASRLFQAVLLCSLFVACEQPAIAWVDVDQQRTDSPSPIAHPPLVLSDSALAPMSAMGEFLETQDRWREAGGMSMMLGWLDDMLDSVGELSTKHVTQPMIPSTDPGRTVAGLLGDGPEPLDSLRCARSLRVVTAAGSDPRQGHGRVAVWWTRASAGRVRLVAAWRDSVPGMPMRSVWRGPISVDTLDQGPLDAQAADRGAHGCARPAPGVTVDSINGYVHVAYALTGPEGSGVFYSHQMTPYAPFEIPLAVLYGSRLGAVRVASDGDLVAVAYEDPNTRGRGRIGLAVSRTAGHSFDDRQIASTGITDSRDPYVVVRGSAIVIGWSDVAASTTEPTFVVRRARLR